MDGEGKQHTIRARFATHVNQGAAEGVLDPEGHPCFAQAPEKWGAATPVMSRALDAGAKAQNGIGSVKLGDARDADEQGL